MNLRKEAEETWESHVEKENEKFEEMLKQIWRTD